MKLYQLYDYRKEKSEPIDLHEFLNRKGNKDKLYNMRCLYVVKPNRDAMLKFGIAGLDGKSSAYGRLFQYVNLYGKQTDLHQCSGVQLLYLVGTKYNPNVETTNSWVFKKRNTLSTTSNLKESTTKTHFMLVVGEKELRIQKQT